MSRPGPGSREFLAPTTRRWGGIWHLPRAVLVPLDQDLAADASRHHDYPEDKPDFVRYAMELRCLDHVEDTKKTPIPSLEDLSKAVTVLMQVELQHNKKPRKELETILKAEGVTKDWFPETHGPCS